MELNQFHFAEIRWLWGLIFIPIICMLYVFFYRRKENFHQLEKFADKHLIPHLLINPKIKNLSYLRSFLTASLLWTLLMLAMAGPRWDFKETKAFKQDNILLILLDLSKSMDANDIEPSRLFRARQEIEDIINLAQNVKIGLIGFAANSHIISPITDDMNNIKHLLPLLGTDLIYVQGSRIVPALQTAEQMLDSEPGNNKSVLIISDGGFKDLDALKMVNGLTRKNIVIHTLGVATEKGVELVGEDGKSIIRNGKKVNLKLEKEWLEKLSKTGNGRYFATDYSDNNTKEILKLINLRNDFQSEEKLSNIRVWKERFYIFIFPAMLIILFWFRKGFSFPIILIVLLNFPERSNAGGIKDELFLSKEQQAKKALEEVEDFDSAAKLFDDPYKKGISYYKAGNYAEAEKYFLQNQRPEVKASALYNLGNSLAKQKKLKEAVKAYEDALQVQPNHEKAKNNLDLVKKMIVEAVPVKKEEKKKRKPEDGDKNFPNGGGGGGGDDDENEDDSNKDKNDQNKEDNKDNQDNKSDKKDNDQNKKNESNDKNSGDQKDKKQAEEEANKDNKNQNGDNKELDKEEDNQDQDKDNKKPDKDNHNKDSKNKNGNEKNKGKSNPPDLNSDTTADLNNQNINTSSGDSTDPSEGGSEQGLDIDQWLNQLSNDHKNFLKNQFYFESLEQNKTTNPNVDPW